MREHLSRELFRAIHKGWRNPGDLAAIAMAHLLELCPRCRKEFEDWRREIGEGVATPEGGDYDAVFDRTREYMAANDVGPEGMEKQVERDRQVAKSRAEELISLPAAQQLDWIRNEANRRSGLLLAEALIEQARRTTPADPHQGCVLAGLARVALHHAPITVYAVELYARALAYLANAIRVIGDLPRADQILSDARYLLRSQGGGDRWVRAEIDGLEGSLRIGQERTEEAIQVLLRALMTYRLENDPERSIAMLLKLGRAHSKRGAYTRALDLLDSPTHLDNSGPMPWLRALISMNRGHYQAKLRRVDDAAESLEHAMEQLGGLGDEITALRCRWTWFDVFTARGDLDRAEETLVAVHTGFSLVGLSYDVALCAFALARFYAGQGRRVAALDMADEALPVFERIGLSRRVEAVRRLNRKLATR